VAQSHKDRCGEREGNGEQPAVGREQVRRHLGQRRAEPVEAVGEIADLEQIPVIELSRLRQIV
jgi:hypothetical protein